MSDGLLSKAKSIRMLKWIVWHSIVFLDLLYVATFWAACVVVPDNYQADLIGRVLTFAAGTHGGELLVTAAIRLYGKADEAPKANKITTTSKRVAIPGVVVNGKD